MKMTDIKIKIQRRINRIENKISHLEPKPEMFNKEYYKGWDMGYLQGQLSILEDQLEDIVDFEKELAEQSAEFKRQI